ncbi:hypothetical protein PACTADRAFT_1117 [Pachysolen tannophilus NRRL Y-2460]|uniref:Uncharacterized protein n=1 Tax=Pachysolen tannophilus NRRL Y-2460 TaxID=669874 RepID=A0A1E4TXN8_PACTA|nr:hypothetical protein PACTADRAFT_1117 [Pachysolen tannophilus NRRL Y-2460]
MVWWPFGSSGNANSGRIKYDEDQIRKADAELASSIPKDLKDYLDNYEHSLTDREFKEKVQLMNDISNLNPAPSVNRAAHIPEVEEKNGSVSSDSVIESNLNAMTSITNEKENIIQSTERLSQDQLKQMREIDEYKRKNPMHIAILENCSEIQYEFINCLSNGPFFERMKGCNDKQNFYDSCLKRQSMIFKMFDYNSMTAIEEFEEIRGIADDTFNRYFKCNDDFEDNVKNKLFTKELKEKREKFYQKYEK